jgi:raffinose/stachyose/melibiose transport system permease protein
VRIISKKEKTNIALEILAIILFLIYLSPFALILINASKPTLQVISDPLALPENPLMFFENIGRILSDRTVSYGSSFVSSVIITVVSVALIILITSMAAWVLVRTKTKTSTFIFMMFVGAIIVPFQVVMFPLISWFATIERTLGIAGTPFRLLGNYPGIILAYMGFGASLSIFLFHGFIKGIPFELEEAANIDGCSRPGIFFRIIFPILKPISITVLILNGMWIWNDFLLPRMVLRGGRNDIQTLPLAVAGFVGQYVRRWDLILTATILAMIPIIVVFLFLQKYIIKGMVEGSVKG